MTPNIEASSPSEAAATVERYSAALWPGIFPTALIPPLLRKIGMASRDPASYASIRYGALHQSVLGELVDSLLTPEIGETFRLMVGGDFDIPPQESPIHLGTAGNQKYEWHQDAGVNVVTSAIVWVALTDCGVTAPGLSFALREPKQPDLRFLYDDGKEAERDGIIAKECWPVVSPIFRAGDAVFFNSNTIHRTHRTPEMTMNRAAFKLTAVPRA